MMIQCQNQSAWVKAIEAELAEYHQQAAKVLLPAGETPRPLYEKWRNHFPDAYRNFEFFQIDEIMDGENRFAQFFKNELPLVTVEPPRQFDLKAKVALLGLGLNGHVGFHEPSIPPSFYSGCVRLSDESCDRLNLHHGMWGLTFGLGAFLNCDKVLLLVRGSAKQKILEAVLAGDKRYPAAYLTTHKNFKVINSYL